MTNASIAAGWSWCNPALKGPKLCLPAILSISNLTPEAAKFWARKPKGRAFRNMGAAQVVLFNAECGLRRLGYIANFAISDDAEKTTLMLCVGERS